MKVLWLLVLTAMCSLAQSNSKAPPVSREMSDLGFVYPLSSDWILATTLMRKQAAAQSDPTSVVLAAVYVPGNKNLTQSSPFFSVIKFRNAKPDCQQFLDTMIPQLEKQGNNRITRKPQLLQEGANEFLRLDFEQKGVLKHRSFLCTTTKEYLVVWNAGARDDKGLETVISTLSSLGRSVPAEPEKSGAPDPQSQRTPGELQNTDLQRVRVASGVTSGLLVKKVPPIYPPEARAAGIQGTVILQAEISREGDIENLEVLDGPIELVGCSVHAVRQWKYKPYMLNGEAVAVQTTIQVNYTLSFY